MTPALQSSMPPAALVLANAVATVVTQAGAQNIRICWDKPWPKNIYRLMLLQDERSFSLFVSASDQQPGFVSVCMEPYESQGCLFFRYGVSLTTDDIMRAIEEVPMGEGQFPGANPTAARFISREQSSLATCLRDTLATPSP